MRSFVMYRHNVPTDTHDENQRNAPDEIQFEGTVFSDHTVVIRWMTAVPSTSVWASMNELMKIHGHPEYDSELVWLDENKLPQSEKSALKQRILELGQENLRLIKQRDRAEQKYDGACHMMENSSGPDGWEKLIDSDGEVSLRPTNWKERTLKAEDALRFAKMKSCHYQEKAKDYGTRVQELLAQNDDLEFGLECERDGMEALQWRYEELERMLRLIATDNHTCYKGTVTKAKVETWLNDLRQRVREKKD
jgi:predicted nuclease with TOPRIM domain